MSTEGKEIKWLNIEKEIATLLIGTLLFIRKTTWKKYTGQNYCVVTLANWKRIYKSLKIDNECSRLCREMKEDPDFTPNITDKILDYWAEKGLVKCSQLLSNHTINSYEVIATKYASDCKHVFKYSQVRSYINKYIEEYKSSNELFQYMNRDRNKDKGSLSKIYKILQKFNIIDDKVKEKWGKELGMNISTEDWKDSLRRNFKTSQSKYWREFPWKVGIRFFITLDKLKKWYPEAENQCWRGCGEQEENYTHCCFTCPVLTPYWKEVEKLLGTYLI